MLKVVEICMLLYCKILRDDVKILEYITKFLQVISEMVLP